MLNRLGDGIGACKVGGDGHCAVAQLHGGLARDEEGGFHAVDGLLEGFAINDCCEVGLPLRIGRRGSLGHVELAVGFHYACENRCRDAGRRGHGHVHCRQPRAAREGAVANCCDGAGQGDALQAGAVLEGTFAHARHRVVFVRSLRVESDGLLHVRIGKLLAAANHRGRRLARQTVCQPVLLNKRLGHDAALEDVSGPTFRGIGFLHAIRNVEHAVVGQVAELNAAGGRGGVVSNGVERRAARKGARAQDLQV